LERRGWFVAAVATGALWAVWHWPLWIPAYSAAFATPSHVVAVVLLASVTATALSIPLTWMFVNTRAGVLLAMLLHGSSNAHMNLMYRAGGDTTLTGLGYIACHAIVVVLMGLIFALGGKFALIRNSPRRAAWSVV
jgi:membrane protease YdiL (CAAX protease family)